MYHWASITAGRYGRAFGFFAGWWNFLAWIFGAASTAQIVAAQIVSMYSIFHVDFVTERWHVFVTYLIITWLCGLITIFGNRALPRLEFLGAILIVLGVVVVVIVCAVMPHQNGRSYATSAFVWRDWVNSTGWSSDGLVFLLGMLNGAFAVGTPDIVSHLAEEIPRYVLPSLYVELLLKSHKTQYEHSYCDTRAIRHWIHQLFMLSYYNFLQHFKPRRGAE